MVAPLSARCPGHDLQPGEGMLIIHHRQFMRKFSVSKAFGLVTCTFLVVAAIKWSQFTMGTGLGIG